MDMTSCWSHRKRNMIRFGLMKRYKVQSLLHLKDLQKRVLRTTDDGGRGRETKGTNFEKET